MGRTLRLGVPLAVFFVIIVFFEGRNNRCISRAAEETTTSQFGALYPTRELQNSGKRQTANDGRGHDLLHSDQQTSSRVGATVPRFGSVNEKLPSCVSDGGTAKSFLVVFMGHSGSSAIISELRSHSRIFIEKPEPVDHFEYEQNTSLALQYTREHFLRGMKAGKVPGFKIRPRHIVEQPEAWAALRKEFDTRIIWQYRNNILKQAVGEYSKQYFKDQSSVEGLRSQDEIKNRCKIGAGCRFKISDFGLLHRILKDGIHSDMAIAQAVNQILNGSKCVHDLPYEDYLYYREETMRNLQRFLGVEYEDTVPKRFKATNDRLCEVVENWDELCRQFYGCYVWRYMFEDTRNGCSCDFSSGSTKYCDTVYS